MSVVQYGPATRGDMELLANYLITPPSSRWSPVPTPLGLQFHDLPVSAVMDVFHTTLRDAIFVPIPLENDGSYFLTSQDWHGILLESEKKLMDSVKRFILHAAIFCSRADCFANPRYMKDGTLDSSRLENVDCLEDFVQDVVAITGFLKNSCSVLPGNLPSLRAFTTHRVAELLTPSNAGEVRQRKYFFGKTYQGANVPTNVYARQVCCVVLGVTSDYDQCPQFGLTHWSNDVLVFDNLEQLLWKGFGVRFKPDKTVVTGITGNIVDLEANFIINGAFSFTRCTRVWEHLTLDRAGRVRIYTSKALSRTAFMFQFHAIAR